MHPESFIINVKVIPRSSVSEVAGKTENEVLRVKVHAVPEKGKANMEVCRVLSEYFGVPRSNVEIVSRAYFRAKMHTHRPLISA